MTSENTRTETVVRPNMTLSKMIWLTFKRQPSGYIERVLDINPYLSDQLILAVGTKVVFPLDEALSAAPSEFEASAEIVKPWD